MREAAVEGLASACYEQDARRLVALLDEVGDESTATGLRLAVERLRAKTVSGEMRRHHQAALRVVVEAEAFFTELFG